MRDDTSRAAVIERLRGWLLQHNPAAAGRAISDDTDIIDGGILDSLQLVEFILVVELESGRTILSERIEAAWLRTLGSIYQHFFCAQAA